MNTLALAAADNHKGVNGVALAVLIALFLLVTVMGFWASKWRQATSMESLDEWGLGGRSFGTWITWFLLGGDLYTAYTFIAVPAVHAGCPWSSPSPASWPRCRTSPFSSLASRRSWRSSVSVAPAVSLPRTFRCSSRSPSLPPIRTPLVCGHLQSLRSSRTP